MRAAAQVLHARPETDAVCPFTTHLVALYIA